VPATLVAPAERLEESLPFASTRLAACRPVTLPPIVCVMTEQ
jgi:hypothetical protein